MIPSEQWLASGLVKFSEMKAGKRVTTCDPQLDALTEYFKEKATHDAVTFFRRVVSIPNPKRVGIYDQYEAWIK